MKDYFECITKTSPYSNRDKMCLKDHKIIPFKEGMCDKCYSNTCTNCYHKDDQVWIDGSYHKTCDRCARKS